MARTGSQSRLSDSLSRVFATRVRVALGDTGKGTLHVSFDNPFASPPAIVAEVDTSYPHLWNAGASNHDVQGCDVTVVGSSASSGAVWVSVIAVGL